MLTTLGSAKLGGLLKLRSLMLLLVAAVVMAIVQYMGRRHFAKKSSRGRRGSSGEERRTSALRKSRRHSSATSSGEDNEMLQVSDGAEKSAARSVTFKLGAEEGSSVPKADDDSGSGQEKTAAPRQEGNKQRSVKMVAFQDDQGVDHADGSDRDATSSSSARPLMGDSLGSAPRTNTPSGNETSVGCDDSDANGKRSETPPPPLIPVSSGGSKSSKKKSSTSSRRAHSSKELAADPTLPDFIMLMGIPGSGKSTWAKEYVFRCDASFTIVSSDDIRRQLTGTVNDQSRNAEVWDTVHNQVMGLLKQGRSVILDATNVRSDFRRIFASELPSCNRYLKTFPIHKAIAKSRMAKELASGADRAVVPDAVLDKMHASFTESMTVVASEGWIMKP